MKACSLLAIGFLALGMSGLAQADSSAPQATPMSTLNFDPGVLATLDSLFGTHSSSDGSKSAERRNRDMDAPGDPDCEPRKPAKKGTAPTARDAVLERGRNGGSDVAPDALPRTPGLSWQSLLPGSIQ